MASFRDQSRYAPSQWETSLHCNDVSHWPGAYLDWSLIGLFHCNGNSVLTDLGLAYASRKAALISPWRRKVLLRYRAKVSRDNRVQIWTLMEWQYKIKRKQGKIISDHGKFIGLEDKLNWETVHYYKGSTGREFPGTPITDMDWRKSQHG